MTLTKKFQDIEKYNSALVHVQDLRADIEKSVDPVDQVQLLVNLDAIRTRLVAARHDAIERAMREKGSA